MSYKIQLQKELDRNWDNLIKYHHDDDDDDDDDDFHSLCNTILHESSEVGDLNKIKYVVRFGADVNNSNRDKVTPLMRSSSDGYPDIVKFLIEKGAHVNAVAYSGNTPLILVTENSVMDKDTQLNIVEQLLIAGANVNAQDKYKKTPLIIATESNGYVELIEKLLKFGADPNIKDDSEETALDIAEINEYMNIKKIIEDYKNNIIYNMSAITSEVKNKEIFVVCTDNVNGVDFKKPLNQKMLKDLFPEYSPVINEENSTIDLEKSNLDFTFCMRAAGPGFPDCLIQNRKMYDMIWFGGCNVIYWLFGTNVDKIRNEYLDLVYNSLNENGKIIFTKNFSWNPNKTLADDKGNLSMDVKEYLKHEHGKNMKIPLGSNYDYEEFIALWNKYFELNNDGKYTFYSKRPTIVTGGRKSKKSRKSRRTRRTRRSRKHRKSRKYI